MRSVAILIVDDNPDIREAIRGLLEAEAYTVIEVSDGQAALALLRASHGPLVALVDYSMPRMNGFAMLREVSGDAELLTRHAYVLLTANDDFLPLNFRILLAALDIPIIGKPFEAQELLDTVATACCSLLVEQAGDARSNVFG